MAETRKGRDDLAWITLALILLSIAILQGRGPLWIELASLLPISLATVALGAASIFYTRVRQRPNFAAMCLSLLQILLFSAAGSLLSYLLAREGGALWDSTFAQWDAAIGFDWLAYVRWVDSHGWMVLPLKLAYASLIPQILVLVLAQGFSGQIRDMRRMILAAMLCGTVTILLSPLFPAVSNFVHLGLTTADFRHVDPWAGYIHLAHFEALRAGTMESLSLTKAQGIITFPSYHAGLATVTLWAFWRTPWVRWPGVITAILTIVATPVDGGHYLVDILAGTGLALACIAVSAKAVDWDSNRLLALLTARQRQPQLVTT
ncbi:phosphatase PAP2 family protein [Sphingomonas lacunae]|uniref:Phosphatase PAP2 family protein n=1 Tax=Sphingomonas lacunae TaxID=2698828 RepID=A0A6M4AVR9_9SPHN|nr:phosphatase PAP2 family protein [Sphingomonas lacunae]QJQ33223.1 phosphatase PAP2 family protein [Sphingomonas lacunae]